MSVTGSAPAGWFRRKVWRYVHLIDWRVLSILLAVVLTLVITAGLYLAIWYKIINVDPATHFGAVFAGWVAGVALFVVGGAAVGIVSLARPEEEPFETRARILFRKQKGPHIEYVVEKMRDWLEPYAETITQVVKVTEYDDAAKMFFLETETILEVRSYVDDVDAPFASSIKYEKFSTPPPGKKSASFTFLRINDKPDGSGFAVGDSINRSFVTNIPAENLCKIEYAINYWIQEKHEENTYTPVRYTQKLALKVENRLMNDNLVVELWTNNTPRRVIVGHSETRDLVLQENMKPGMRVYNFNVSLERAAAQEEVLKPQPVQLTAKVLQQPAETEILTPTEGRPPVRARSKPRKAAAKQKRTEGETS
ncbi:hypothetical protein ACVILI_003442 [Mesorhizobium sp. USDA 4775]|uniref:hypothetical protein n=1 Tax=Mesorhizobium jarvisii TaxID=1777867 RepID=UPI0011DCF714|nr:hypothetical protein [Mesorhizobium jarvisii]AID29561.2 hypothetical protein MCHK_1746 [Mesorhizobium huakuii 7653R]MCH4556661.1 hypothetical protein [Mesorhizobium jarvisii]